MENLKSPSAAHLRVSDTHLFNEKYIIKDIVGDVKKYAQANYLKLVQAELAGMDIFKCWHDNVKGPEEIMCANKIGRYFKLNKKNLILVWHIFQRILMIREFHTENVKSLNND